MFSKALCDDVQDVAKKLRKRRDSTSTTADERSEIESLLDLLSDGQQSEAHAEAVLEDWKKYLQPQLDSEHRTQQRTSWKLSPGTHFSVENGRYSKYVKLQRGKRFITFYSNVWGMLRRHVPRLRTANYQLELTSDKSVQVVDLSNDRYWSFHHTWKDEEDNVHTNYINLREHEWAVFLDIVHEIDEIIPTRAILPCPACHSMRKVMLVKHLGGRTQKTKLTPEQLAAVRENNAVSYNQLMLECEYCGVAMYDPERCHCHKYNCRMCESDNFCKTCGNCMIFAV